MGKALLWIVIIVGVVAYFGYGRAPSSPTATAGTTAPTQAAAPAPAPAPTIDKSEAMQEERLALLQKLISNRVFTKIEQPGNLVRAYVGPAFYAATIDQKQSFASVVYAYWYDGSNSTDVVRIFDGNTGKEIGSYPNGSGRIEMW